MGYLEIAGRFAGEERCRCCIVWLALRGLCLIVSGILVAIGLIDQPIARLIHADAIAGRALLIRKRLCGLIKTMHVFGMQRAVV